MKGSTFYFSTHSVDCPVCNNPVAFRSNYTNINTCGNCNTILERTEGSGTCKKLALPINKTVNNSLIAIGTRGTYNKRNFEVTGSLRCFTKRFFSNRWTILYSDGTVGTLSETLGFYVIHEKIEADHPGKLQLVSGLETGVDTTDLLKDKPMRVFDTARCEKVAVEGEVLLTDDDGIFSMIELADEAGARLELIEYSKGKFELCRLHYVLVAELSLANKNSRPVEAVTLPCAECRKPVTITLPQYCEDVVCPACNQWNERKGDHLELKNKTLNKFKPDLPIGSKGKIKDIDYEVVAACRKCQPGIYNEIWTEYSLYNKETGFAFLAEYNGHWTYLKEVKLGIKYPFYEQEIVVGNENYVLFNEYNFKVTAAAGEFFVPLDSGGAIRAKEFISPPEMYAVENNNSKEITWYKGEHIANKDVFEGLNLPHKTMPLQTGIGPLQPMKGYTNMRLLKRMSLIALAVFLAVQVFFSFTAKNETVFEEAFIIPDSLSSKGIVSKSFDIKPTSSNLEFSIGAPVNNSWFDADITLVNDKTGREYHIDKGVEYYAGYSDGEHWTEGSKDADAMLSSVPGGTYHLNIFTSSGGDGGKVGSFAISVRNDVPMFRNFFFVVLIASLFPLLQWGRTQLFEGRRWNNNSSTKNND